MTKSDGKSVVLYFFLVVAIPGLSQKYEYMTIAQDFYTSAIKISTSSETKEIKTSKEEVLSTGKVNPNFQPIT